MLCHDKDYTIIGHDMQMVEVELTEGLRVYSLLVKVPC